MKNTMSDWIILAAFIGILSAVAIPAYGAYTVQAKAAPAPTHRDGLNMPQTELYMTSGFF
jgi:Tfp pilus assembly major pilin PilA